MQVSNKEDIRNGNFIFVGAKWFFASFSLGLEKFQIAWILNFFFGRRGWGRGDGQLLP